MRVEVLSSFRANGQIYAVGDRVDLADAFAAELMFCRKVRPAPPEPPKRKRTQKGD